MDKTSANIAQNAKKDRQRAENWTREEKDLLLAIMDDSAPIIENKQTDTNNNRRKNLEWLKVQTRLTELTGKSRDVLQIKGFWRRLKLTAKKNVSQNKKSVRMTGGGNRPPSPSNDDQKIAQLCPTDFIVEINQFDSDGKFENVSLDEQDKENTTVQPKSTIIYDIDLNENIQENSNIDGLCVDEIVTVQDINDEEVQIDKNENINTEINEIKQSQKKNHKTKPRKTESSHKGMVLASNIEFKNFSRTLLQEEHQLKMKYQKLELSHQQLRHKMEVDILLLEKEKKELEIRLLKKSLE